MGDPRAHAAVICASTSCPALRREPFSAARLDAQLDDAMRSWMADPGKGLKLDRAGNTIHLSKIYDWFEEDFAAQCGALKFDARYAPEDTKDWLKANASLVLQRLGEEAREPLRMAGQMLAGKDFSGRDLRGAAFSGEEVATCEPTPQGPCRGSEPESSQYDLELQLSTRSEATDRRQLCHQRVVQPLRRAVRLEPGDFLG